MGLPTGASFCGTEGCVRPAEASQEAVMPSGMKVRSVSAQGPYTALWVRYESATNYDGLKIMVYRCDWIKLIKYAERKGLDPHFCEANHPSPIARFEPTQEGWDNAKAFMKMRYASD